MRLNFTMNESLRDEFDDMPAAPGAATGTATAVEVDGGADPSMFEGVATMGEVIPIGTYHFRLDRYTEGVGGFKDDHGQPTTRYFGDGSPIPDQPYFNLLFVCQQEPHTGRVFADFAPWVSKEVRTKAAAGDAIARELLKDRLWKIKSIMEAAGFKPAGNFDLKRDFLAEHPEVKIQLGLTEGKSKDATGKYVVDGSQRNKSIKYLPLFRPA